MSEVGDQFLRQQYEALRAEILATQRRDFQVIGIGLLIVPALNYLDRGPATPLVLALPAIAIVIILLHLANEHAIFRCASYIRECIEPILGKDAHERGEAAGWENWLLRIDTIKGNRAADRYMRVGVTGLLISYLFGALWFATEYACLAVPSQGVGALALVIVYILISCWLTPHMWRNLSARASVSGLRISQTAQERAIFEPAVGPTTLPIVDSGIKESVTANAQNNIVHPSRPLESGQPGA